MHHVQMATNLYFASGNQLQVTADPAAVREALSRDLAAEEAFTQFATKPGRAIWIAASSVTHFAETRPATTGAL